MVRNPNQTDDVRSNRREGEEEDDDESMYDMIRMKIRIQRFTHTKLLCSFSLGRTLHTVHQSLLLTLTPIYIQVNMGLVNMGRKWVYGRKPVYGRKHSRKHVYGRKHQVVYGPRHKNTFS